MESVNIIKAEKPKGGKRAGSGAKKKYGEETATISFRCPESKLEELKTLVNNLLLTWKK